MGPLEEEQQALPTTELSLLPLMLVFEAKWVLVSSPLTSQQNAELFITFISFCLSTRTFGDFPSVTGICILKTTPFRLTLLTYFLAFRVGREGGS